MTFATDAREDVDVPPFDLAPGIEEPAAGNGEDPEGASDDRCLQLSPKLTLAEMRRHSLQFLSPAARFLARGVATLLTSLGGVGKTRLLLQLLFQLESGQSPFGCDWLRPDRPMRCLYIGAEDHGPFFNEAARCLLVNDEETLPFDHVLLPEVWPGFTLNQRTARLLARFIDETGAARGGYDCVAIDPMMSVIDTEYVDLMKNPIIARRFFNDCLAPLLRSQAYALITANHDSKTGAAVSGSADQQNTARCVLQLSTEGPTPDGTTSIAAARHKDNLGFRFSKLILERDPNRLLLTWNESTSVYAYGAPAGHAAPEGRSRDPADVMRYLCRQAARRVDAPPDQRTKGKMEALLTQHAAHDGIKNARDHVRRCVNGFCDFERDPAPRPGRRLLLVGVRNPDAAIDEHDDYLAGHAAAEDEEPPCS